MSLRPKWDTGSGFGKLMSGGMSGFRGVDAATTEARSFVDLIGRVRLSAVWRSQYTPNGLLSYPTMDLTLLPAGQDEKLGKSPQQTKARFGTTKATWCRILTVSAQFRPGFWSVWSFRLRPGNNHPGGLGSSRHARPRGKVP